MALDIARRWSRLSTRGKVVTVLVVVAVIVLSVMGGIVGALFGSKHTVSDPETPYDVKPSAWLFFSTLTIDPSAVIYTQSGVSLSDCFRICKSRIGLAFDYNTSTRTVRIFGRNDSMSHRYSATTDLYIPPSLYIG